ncbi:SHOCT domain-containing protein [Enterococcus sp. C21(2024)]|uniref:SHOCT domain-containing protein n=1 Tax=unclassified Enterococcus TaxID=2608891 RepID=UPI00349FDF88
MAAVEVFRFFVEIPTPIKSDKNQPIEPKLFDSQKNSPSAIEDVMAELRNLKLLVDEGILTEEEFQQKKRQLLKLD